jgi:GMP synthase-like glutamine amidotransferase
VYALQFHIEVTPAIVRDWLASEKGIDLGSITAESEKSFPAYLERAMKFYRGFLGK